MTTFQQVHQTFCAIFDAQTAADAAAETAGTDTVAGEYAAAAARSLNVADAVLATRDLDTALRSTEVAAALLTDALTASTGERTQLEVAWLGALEAIEHLITLTEI